MVFFFEQGSFNDVRLVYPILLDPVLNVVAPCMQVPDRKADSEP
jgi:hypothetical protein